MVDNTLRLSHQATRLRSRSNSPSLIVGDMHSYYRRSLRFWGPEYLAFTMPKMSGAAPPFFWTQIWGKTCDPNWSG